MVYNGFEVEVSRPQQKLLLKITDPDGLIRLQERYDSPKSMVLGRARNWIDDLSGLPPTLPGDEYIRPYEQDLVWLRASRGDVHKVAEAEDLWWWRGRLNKQHGQMRVRLPDHDYERLARNIKPKNIRFRADE